ncbi:MAG: isocitrate/isopropylmalate dehydrogenase family protein [archaeon]
MKKILVIKGDGIGPEVTEAAIKVLNALNFNAKYEEAYAGFACHEKTGVPVPEETIEMAKKSDAILFGAVTTPSKDMKAKSAILSLRQNLDLFANIRPARTYKGLGRYGDENVDILIVRENTECLYSGIGEMDEKLGIAINQRIISKKATERIANAAARFANGKITITHKANVVKPSDVLFLSVASETLKKLGKEFDSEIVDALAMKLVVNPAKYRTILAPNLYGDILSDLVAGIAGSIGLCPSANIGEKIGLFEPVHGSAPDIAGKGIANPCGAILSAALMLDFLGEKEGANKVRLAVESVIVGRKSLTPDLGGKSKTNEMLNSIIQEMEVL